MRDATDNVQMDLPIWKLSGRPMLYALDTYLTYKKEN